MCEITQVLANGAPVVLVVEDDESIRWLVAELLTEDGVIVRQAGNGMAALRLALEERPDLVVLDVALPDLDGVAVAHQLRGICGPDLPILAMTADEQIAKRAFEMDAYSLLEKPFELEHLLVAVRRGLVGHTRQREVVQDDVSAEEWTGRS